jgi:DNA-directed RNA polymerase subunit M/transcription elongation factor TFIIS
MGQSRRGCIFCGSTKKISKEHLYPDWLKNYIPKPKRLDRYVVQVKTLKSFDAIGRPSYSITKGKMDRPGTAISQTVRVVCEKCNNEWMSRLQEEARPILAPLVLGVWGEIEEPQREVLARWITMFAMVLDCSEPLHTAITQQQRSEFFRTNKPLPEWFMWIGYLKTTYPTARSYHSIMNFTDSTKMVPEIKPSGTHITVGVLGNLVFQAFSTIEKRLWAHIAFKFNPFQILTPIWPNFRGLTNKPTTVIRDDQPEALRNTLRDFIYSLNPRD